MRKKNRPGRNSLSGLLLVELEDIRWSHGLEKWLSDLQPAGVVLVGSRLPAPEATRDFLIRVARTSTAPPILALRENGGSLSPLRRYFPQIPSPRDVARKGPQAARKLGELIGTALKLLGFNLTLAPSLDLSAPFSDLLLDNHIFSADPETVMRCGGAFIRGLRKHGILAAPGHFPGISDAEQDGAAKLPIADKSMAEIWREDLLPFRKLLRQVPSVVISPVAYKAYDFDLARPACASYGVLQGLLRKKLDFRGVAMSDMPNAARLFVESMLTGSSKTGAMVVIRPRAYGECIAAGCDLHVVWHGEAITRLVLGELAQMVDSGLLPPQRIGEAVQRVQLVRETLRRPRGQLSLRAFNRVGCGFRDFAKQ